VGDVTPKAGAVAKKRDPLPIGASSKKQAVEPAAVPVASASAAVLVTPIAVPSAQKSVELLEDSLFY